MSIELKPSRTSPFVCFCCTVIGPNLILAVVMDSTCLDDVDQRDITGIGSASHRKLAVSGSITLYF